MITQPLRRRTWHGASPAPRPRVASERPASMHEDKPMSDVPMIRVVDVHKRFGDLEVLKGVSFDVHRGNVLSMIGASGSGKSTLLRCINYLEVPTAGDILIDGESLCYRGNGNGDRRPRSPSEVNRIRRELGIVFQQFNLWPHMTVMGNIIEAPMRVRGMSRGEAEALAESLPRARAAAREGEGISRAAVRRPAAARRHRPRARDATQGDAVRRGDVLARPRAHRRSARRDARPRRRRHDDDRGDARDGLRARRVRPRDVPAQRARRGGRPSRRRSSARRARSGCASSSPSTSDKAPPMSDSLREILDVGVFWEFREILLQGSRGQLPRVLRRGRARPGPGPWRGPPARRAASACCARSARCTSRSSATRPTT